MEMVGAIVLAAGNSSRLGRPKQLLLHEGEALVCRSARAAIAGGCAPVVIVVGAEGSRIEQEVAGLAACIVHHPEWSRGIGTSIRAGLGQIVALAPELDALVMLVCDQPFVTAELIVTLRATCAAKRTNVACSYADTIGLPALFTRSYFPKLATLPDDCGARDLLAQRPRDFARVPFPEGAIDIDTAADCRAHLSGEESSSTASAIYPRP